MENKAYFYRLNANWEKEKEKKEVKTKKHYLSICDSIIFFHVCVFSSISVSMFKKVKVFFFKNSSLKPIFLLF